MVTLAEIRERNRRLKAEAEVREDMIKMNEERRRLEKENKFLERGGKESAGARIKKAFTQTGQTLGQAGRKGFHGLRKYAEYREGYPEKKEHERHGRQVIFKKIGKNKYKRIVVRKRQHFKPKSRPRPQRHSQFGPSAFGGGSEIFGQSKSLFRRTI